MDIERFRNFCLALPETTEAMPFRKFANGRFDILVFYVGGHMYCYFDINNFTTITIKASPEKIAELKERYQAVNKPFNGNPKYWISVRFNADLPECEILTLVEQSYKIVKGK